jgi:outer membrane protein assembly factor BamB
MLVVALVLGGILALYLMGQFFTDTPATNASTTVANPLANSPKSSIPNSSVEPETVPTGPPNTVPTSSSTVPPPSRTTASVPTTLPLPSGTAPVAPPPTTSGGDDAVAFQMTPGHTGYSPDQVGPKWQKVWTKSFGSNNLPFPLIVNGQIYELSGADGGSLTSVRASTGTVNWQVVAGDAVGAAYVDGEVIVVTSEGVMSSYTATTGASVWSTTLPGQTEFYAPTAADGMVFAGAAGVGGTVYGVDASDGVLVWTGSVENGNTSIPAVSSNGMYVTYACAQTYGFDPTSGRPLWHHSTGC